MSSVVKAFSDLLQSIVEVFASIIHTTFSAIQSIFALAGHLIGDIFNAAGGIIEFLLANIFVIGTIMALFFGFILYTQRQGQAKPVANKKTS